MKRFFVFAGLFLIAASSAFCADKVPAWFKDSEKAYPESEFITATGSGRSEKNAQNSALSNIALYFDTKIDVVNLSVKEMGELVQDGETHSFENEAYSQAAKVRSTAEFFCVSFTDSYYNKKEDTYYVLAYINRKEAAKIYTSRINALMESVKSYRDYAKTEKEIFLASEALHKAEVISKNAEQYIKDETIIVPSDTAKWQGALKTISEISAERNALKKQMTFSIILNQNEKQYAPVFSTVASIVEKRGYSYSVKDSNYKIVIDISAAEEMYDAGPFVRASVDILILNNAGTGVYTYSKAYPRTGGKTTEQAYTRAVSKINADLEENFLGE